VSKGNLHHAFTTAPCFARRSGQNAARAGLLQPERRTRPLRLGTGIRRMPAD
jgi:hypothetical protein